MRKRNIKKLIESMTKKKKKKPVQSSAVKDALIGRKHFYAPENFNKGGRVGLKRGGGKFPDHSGDGKITQKDILMAKGVIPKKKNKKKVI